jgi:serine/threonine protein kinase
MDQLAPGRVIGKYKVVRRLAMGGMAEIFLAQARGIEGFEKYVVLKRILPQFAASQTFIRLFLNEARVAATLDHPNIASVYDIGESDGMYFFAMEYLHGEDLGHLLRELVRRSERIPIEHALTIMVGVAAGLHAAHEKRGPDGRPLGIVHRDVSPSNVVVTYDGGVKLVDFGVAKMTANAELTKSGSVKGKLAYMSPEQCNGVVIDRRSDVFALGILLFELTTQTRLFKGESEAATLKMVLDARVPPPSARVPDYPTELEPIIFKALARERDERFATAREVQIALEEVARGRGLLTSIANLGEWMTSFLGPKPEPWLGAAEGEQEERGGPEVGAAPPRLSAPVIQSSQLDPENATIVTGIASQMSKPRSTAVVRRRRWLLATGGTLGVVAVGAVGLASWGLRSNAVPPATDGSKLVFVVPESGEMAPEGESGTEGGIQRAAAAPAPSDSVKAAPAAVSPSRSQPSRPRPRSSRSEGQSKTVRGDSLSQAFALKEREIAQCYSRFPEQAARAPQLFVGFRAGTDGVVTSAHVLPEEIAGTPLGACVARVAATTRFGPQPAPIAFRIPVTVTRFNQAQTRGRP